MIFRRLKLCFLLCALALCLGASAQGSYIVSGRAVQTDGFLSATFYGQVVDSLTREALPGAVISVVTINPSGEKYVRNHVTDDKGGFRFWCYGVQNRMEIVSLGYKPLTVNLFMDKEEKNLGQILLSQSTQEIDEVVVKGRMQMYKMKGDTILYLPRAVKTMKDDPALEILRHMPGVEVDDGGGVKILGQQVERTYVNQKLLFGDDPTAALRELDAKEVASIESYDEVDEADAVANGVNARKRKVLNVVTFKEFTQSYSAKARGEIGTDFQENAANERPVRYLASGNVNFYSEKLQLNASGGSNNLTMAEGGAAIPFTSRRQSNASASVSGSSGDRRHHYQAGYYYGGTSELKRSASSSDYFPTDYFTSQYMQNDKRSDNESDSHSLSGSYDYTRERLRLETSLEARLYNSNNLEQWSQRVVRDGAALSATEGTDKRRGNLRSLDWSASSSWRFENGNSVFASTKVDLHGGRFRGMRLEQRTTDGVETPLGWRILTPVPGNNVGVNAGYNLDFGKAGNLSFESGVQYAGLAERMLYTDLETGLRDEVRSEDAFDKTVTWNVGPKYLLTGENFSFSAELNYLLEKRVYDDAGAGTTDRRNFHFATGSIYYRYNKPKKNFSVSFDNSYTPVKGRLFSSRIDDSSPLYVSTGNRTLVPTKQYKLGFTSEFLGEKSSYGFSTYLTAESDPIMYRRVFFEEETLLPQYDNYRMPAGSTLTTPENGAALFKFQIAARYKVRIAPLRLFLELFGMYYFSNPQEQLYDREERVFRHGVQQDTRLTTNFSSQFRIVVNNAASYNFQKRFGHSSREFRDVLKADVEWDIFGRLFLTAGYTGIFSSSSARIATPDTHLLNLSLGCRVFKERGRIAFNAYDVLNDYSPIRISQTVEGISTTVDYVGANYFTVSFEYKFNNRRAAK